MEKFSTAGEVTDEKWLMRISCLILRLQTNTIGICNTYGFILQQWLHERASMLQCYDVRTLPVLLIFLIKTNPLHLLYDMYPDQILRTICNSIRT